MKRILFTFYIFSTITAAQIWHLPNFVADTTVVTIPGDTLFTSFSTNSVEDQRSNTGNLICILQDNKWMFIPVDHYYVIKQPLADMVNWYLGSSLADYHNNKLIIGNVTYWEDKNPIFSKGPILNGYTKLVDENGKTIKDWQWEIRVKKSRNKKTEEIIGDLLADWMNTQKASLTNIEPNPTISPFPYCRQLLSWFDIIYLSDGYIIDARLSLDFPTDQMDKYIRGVRGIYYRRSSRHESIAIGGKDQQWYYRLNR